MGHRLSEKDLEAMTATCATCGPGASIVRSRNSHVCREGRREAKRRFKQAHPERVRQDKRRPPSKHRLTGRDGEPDLCAICGPVSPVVMGRGWMCPNRATELGWTQFAVTPQPKCPVCATYLDRFGACAHCDDDWDIDSKFIPAESRRYQGADVASEYLEHGGFSIRSFESPLGDDLPESVVRNWKTIGRPDEFKGVRPEYAKLYGAGRR